MKSNLKRYDIKKIYSNKDLRRQLIAESTRITMLRENLVVSLEDCLKSYDEMNKEKS